MKALVKKLLSKKKVTSIESYLSEVDKVGAMADNLYKQCEARYAK
ncbi:hypothetical protein ACLVL5_06210 [Streptococcus pneumoniae]